MESKGVLLLSLCTFVFRNFHLSSNVPVVFSCFQFGQYVLTSTVHREVKKNEMPVELVTEASSTTSTTYPHILRLAQDTSLSTCKVINWGFSRNNQARFGA